MSKLFFFGNTDPMPMPLITVDEESLSISVRMDDEAMRLWAEKQIRENLIVVVVEVDALEPIHAREALGDEEC